MPEASLDAVVDAVVDEIQGRFETFYPNVENIQDIVEKHLMHAGLYEVAKAYILYRAERQKLRESAREQAVENARLGKLTVVKRDGRTVLFNVKRIEASLLRAAEGLEADVDIDALLRESINNVYDGIPTNRIEQAMVLATTGYIERDPAYSRVAARLLLQRLFKEVVGRSLPAEERDAAYRAAVLPAGVPRLAVEAGVSDFWRKYVGLEGDVIGIDRFGESAPAADVFRFLGFTVDNVLARARKLIGA